MSLYTICLNQPVTNTEQIFSKEACIFLEGHLILVYCKSGIDITTLTGEHSDSALTTIPVTRSACL